jgi:hypothetical protein
MEIYSSEDGRNCTSTFNYPPVNYLTPKGLRNTNTNTTTTTTTTTTTNTDTDAAIIIQRWWKNINLQLLIERDIESYMADNSDNTVEYIRNRSYKRKLDEMLDSDFDVEEINTSESTSESESESVEHELQTVINNSLLWDCWLLLYNFLWKVLGY